MNVPAAFARHRKKGSPPGWLVAVASIVLSWTFAATATMAQDGPGSTVNPETKPVAKAKQRPKLLGRLFGDKAPPETKPLPELPPQGPKPAAPAIEKPPVSAPVAKAPVDSAVVPAQTSENIGYSYENISNVPVGSETDRGLLRRLLDAYKLKPPEPAPPDPNAPPSRRGFDAPFKAPPMPFSDFIGPNVGINDTSVFPFMDALYRGKNGQAWKDSRIKIYGWVDPIYNASTSKSSNIPLSYSIVPNSLQLSQVILIFERPLDTVQTDHYDWGFRVTNLYGIDYRYTTALGYFSDQLLKHNRLYGYDPLQLYVDQYFPHIGDGTVLRIGRYISPLDIEAQLSPENFLYTHSNMYTYDPYTFTGIQFTTRINDQWQIIYGVHAGNDMAPWTTSAQANGEILVKWISKDNKDSVYGGLDSIGHGYYKNGHDDLQVFGFTWTHKFNDRFTTMTEQYFIWQRNALQGGTVTNGPPEPYFPSVGPGTLLHGLSTSYGIVNYTSYVVSDKGMLVFRSDCLADFRGERTGIPGAYFEHTLGYVHHLTPWAILRPEVRFDYTSGQRGYDNGTKRDQFTFAMDMIIRF
jgi:Putative beta-barrel porin-2, OmpL-like. bbp2